MGATPPIGRLLGVNVTEMRLVVLGGAPTKTEGSNAGAGSLR